MRRSVIDAVGKGLAAGMAGAWVLDRVTWYLWDRQRPGTIARELAVRPQRLDPARVLAARLASAQGRSLGRRQLNRFGGALHHLLAIAPAIAYAALQPRGGGTMRPARGMGFGLAVFVLGDNLLNRASGLCGPLDRYPWQAYFRGLVGHLCYGVAIDAALAHLDELTRPKSIGEPPRRQWHDRGRLDLPDAPSRARARAIAR